jgi:hypothetical protein
VEEVEEEEVAVEVVLEEVEEGVDQLIKDLQPL